MHTIIFGLPAFLVCVTSLASRFAQAQTADSPTFHINSQRLKGTLEKLSEFGRNPEGGVTRLGFSETDLAAREYVTGLMKQAALEVRVDPAGNIFGLRAGSEKLPILYQVAGPCTTSSRRRFSITFCIAVFCITRPACEARASYLICAVCEATASHLPLRFTKTSVHT